jgi:hypothetical protein
LIEVGRVSLLRTSVAGNDVNGLAGATAGWQESKKARRYDTWANT